MHECACKNTKVIKDEGEWSWRLSGEPRTRGVPHRGGGPLGTTVVATGPCSMVEPPQHNLTQGPSQNNKTKQLLPYT